MMTNIQELCQISNFGVNAPRFFMLSKEVLEKVKKGKLHIEFEHKMTEKETAEN